MGALFSKPKSPAPPPAPPPVPTVDNTEVAKAAEEERLRTQNRRGLAANILTSPTGLSDSQTGSTMLGTRTLLGR